MDAHQQFDEPRIGRLFANCRFDFFPRLAENLEIAVNGETGALYRLESSTDLVLWESANEFHLERQGQQISVADEVDYRFLRVVLVKDASNENVEGGTDPPLNDDDEETAVEPESESE